MSARLGSGMGPKTDSTYRRSRGSMSRQRFGQVDARGVLLVVVQMRRALRTMCWGLRVTRVMLPARSSHLSSVRGSGAGHSMLAVEDGFQVRQRHLHTYIPAVHIFRVVVHFHPGEAVGQLLQGLREAQEVGHDHRVAVGGNGDELAVVEVVVHVDGGGGGDGGGGVGDQLGGMKYATPARLLTWTDHSL